MDPATTGLVSYRSFASEHAGLDRDAFVARVKDWVLLVWTALDDADNTANFATIIGASPPHVPKGRTPHAVARLIKRPGANPFALMVTLGRAQNNDVVLNHGAVSKFHAYLRQLGAGWFLSDAGSTNGTAVDGIALARERSVPLKSGARIQLGGEVDLELLAPADLHARLG
jgi:pSer/pThr/pTyr-binding forkhead associated (FHA) protein